MREAQIFFRFGEGNIEKLKKRKILNGSRRQSGHARQEFVPQTVFGLTFGQRPMTNFAMTFLQADSFASKPNFRWT